jgi:hypothetical protein
LPATITLGRPVLPPDVGAFHDGLTTRSSGPASYRSWPGARLGSAGATSLSSPTTPAGRTTARIAARNAGELGSPIET